MKKTKTATAFSINTNHAEQLKRLCDENHITQSELVDSLMTVLFRTGESYNLIAIKKLADSLNMDVIQLDNMLNEDRRSKILNAS